MRLREISLCGTGPLPAELQVSAHHTSWSGSRGRTRALVLTHSQIGFAFSDSLYEGLPSGAWCRHDSMVSDI